MPITKYSRYRPGSLDDIDISDLLEGMSDYLLNSGFSDFYSFEELTDHTMDELRRALLKTLLEQGHISSDQLEELTQDADSFEDSELSKLLDRLIQRMQDEGFINVSDPDPDLTAAGGTADGTGSVGETQGGVQFELTDKSIDFLGFRALRNLLGGLGKASLGQHETRELSTGVELTGSTKRYEFGDTLNLDVSKTLLSAIQRDGLKLPIDLRRDDLHVHQAEYRSSCATVLMLRRGSFHSREAGNLGALSPDAKPVSR